MLAPTLDQLTVSTLGIAFLAALAGGLHCAAMCGPLRLLVGQGLRSRIEYQLGRLLAYLFLGLLGGVFGFLLPWWLGLGLAGVLILLPANSFKNLLPKINPAASALGLGLGSALLPCGWLHGWIAIAIAAKSVWQAPLILFVLWLGSLPALEFFSDFFRIFLQPLRQRFPKFLPVFFLLLALLPFAWRGSRAFLHRSAQSTPTDQRCHY